VLNQQLIIVPLPAKALSFHPHLTHAGGKPQERHPFNLWRGGMTQETTQRLQKRLNYSGRCFRIEREWKKVYARVISLRCWNHRPENTAYYSDNKISFRKRKNPRGTVGPAEREEEWL